MSIPANDVNYTRGVTTLSNCALLLKFAIPFICAVGATRGAEEHDVRLTSIAARATDVVATSETDLYKALPSRHEWAHLVLPDEMPSGGQMASEPATATQLYYYAAVPDKGPPPGKTYGIYRSSDGHKWTLVKRSDGVFDVHVLADGNVYDLEWRDGNTPSTRLEESPDNGTSWRDITNNAGNHLLSIESDPEHPRLIGVIAQGIRPVLLRADDDNYHWIEDAPGWPGHRKTSEEFLAREYSGGSVEDDSYLIHATLANYFEHPFGSQISIPAFDIVARQTIYQFTHSAPKLIEINLSFDPGDNTVVKMADADDVTKFWSAKVIDPADRRKITPPPDATALRPAQPAAQPGLTIFTIDRKHPYHRTIDLAALVDFTVPGKYRVQLRYGNNTNPRGRGVWSGQVDGEVFTVIIGKWGT